MYYYFILFDIPYGEHGKYRKYGKYGKYGEVQRLNNIKAGVLILELVLRLPTGPYVWYGKYSMVWDA